MKFLNTMKMHAGKFWCLWGFVAIIFTLFALRSLYICAIALLYGVIPFWGLLSAALMSIFAYYWVSRVLAKPGRYKSTRSYTSNYDRDIDL